MDERHRNCYHRAAQSLMVAPYHSWTAVAADLVAPYQSWTAEAADPAARVQSYPVEAVQSYHAVAGSCCLVVRD